MSLEQADRNNPHAAQRLHWVYPAMILLVAAVFRLETLTARPLWYDELFTQEVVTRAVSLIDVWSIGHRDGGEHPPLFYATAWLFSGILPLETALRLPSTIAALLLIPILILLGRELGSERAGYLAAGIFAISSYAIDYSQEARSYMLLVLGICVTLYCFRCYLSNGGLRWIIFSAICGLGTLYTHHLAWMAAPALIAAWVQAVLQMPRQLAFARSLRSIIAAFFVLALYGPQFHLLSSYLALTNVGEKHRLAPSFHLAVEMFHRWTSGLGVLWILFWFVGLFSIIVKRKPALDILCLCLIPCGFFALVPFSKFFDLRFVFPAFPAVLMVCALGLDTLLARFQRLSAGFSSAIITALLLLAYSPSVLVFLSFRAFPDRCHNFFYRAELLDMNEGLCERHIILNSLNPRQGFLLRGEK